MIPLGTGGGNIHEANNKESSNGNFLSHTKSKLEHFDNRQGQDDNIKSEMSETSAEEKLSVIDLTDGAFDVLVPVGLNRNAMEDNHESTEDEPGHAEEKQNLDRNSNSRLFEDAPVEEKNGQFRETDRVRVGVGDKELHHSCVEVDVFIFGIAHGIGDRRA
jgi:hypothetical protein